MAGHFPCTWLCKCATICQIFAGPERHVILFRPLLLIFFSSPRPPSCSKPAHLLVWIRSTWQLLFTTARTTYVLGRDAHFAGAFVSKCGTLTAIPALQTLWAAAHLCQESSPLIIASTMQAFGLLEWASRMGFRSGCGAHGSTQNAR